ncbi:MAG: 4Fe-4S binding protein [Promethearchaeota archaeon]
MVSIKELTDELNTHCVKIGIDIVGFGDSIHFNKFNKVNRPESYLKNSKSVIVIGFHLYKPGLYLKDAAALAGIGPIGKNNLLITKTFGSQVRLRALVTVAELSYGTPIHESDYCNNCRLCVDSCPAGALEGGQYNKELCNNYCLENLKNLSENTVIWCNICIEACPIGK